jgi:hypothetical protein
MDEEVKSSPMNGFVADSDMEDSSNQMRKDTSFS